MFKKKQNILVVSCFFYLFSCGTIKQSIVNHNYFNNDFFYNDSIKVSIDFLGNVIQEDLSKLKKQQLKNELRQIKEISYDNLFIKCHPQRDKRFNMYYFFEKINYSKDTLSHVNVVKLDEINNIAICEKWKGNRKVICVVKSFIKDDFENTKSRAKKCINSIYIDSIISNKISYLSVFNNYTTFGHNYLEARKKIKTAPIFNKNDFKYQFLRTVNSFMENNNEYDSLMVKYEIKRKEKYNDFVKNLKGKPNIYYNDSIFTSIKEIGMNSKIIILNEDHNYPSHRIFGMEILSALKKSGYKYISLEAFNKDDKDTFIPNKKNGVYIDEPYFAHFIRKANNLGFVISGHENYNDDIDRELGQAKNILKILEKDPHAKVFVYVGQSHLEKSNDKKKWMAQYLKELSGINPITINQSTVIADNKEELMLIPSLYFKEGPDTKSSADYFLINRIHPSLDKIYNETPFRLLSIENSKFKEYKKQEVLVEIFNLDEFNMIKKLSIPIDRHLVIPNGKKIQLNLPIGKYHIFVKTEDNKTIYDNDLFVE